LGIVGLDALSKSCELSLPGHDSVEGDAGVWLRRFACLDWEGDGRLLEVDAGVEDLRVGDLGLTAVQVDQPADRLRWAARLVRDAEAGR
jgi:hypothetical protein